MTTILLDQPQSEILVLARTKFQIYNILVEKWKHGKGTNDIIYFNK